MKLEIKDSPGQLVAALKPISDVGGNIKSVIHERDPLSENGTLDVQIWLELPEGKLNSLIETLKENDVSILRVGEERFIIRKSVIIIGHLMHTDLSDTVDRIDGTGYAEVGELSMVMPAINEPTSAKMTIKSDSVQDIDRAMAILQEVAEQKGFLIIEPLEGF
ncbi:amino acid-binding protein [Methanoplanus sp. FWC-SCC4]|uniref:Amino acid-binding protein n=1 Tax=Methanochimaera problematica TaxID=2609417 RepID=A0AA97FE66_9EURY|nr:amino acid-binding protein [Methanoplanus sp. FWC-SCC4]WOF17304.1 amino acid-binding protein [Methanoplanus sp. FWC-SCC4]